MVLPQPVPAGMNRERRRCLSYSAEFDTWCCGGGGGGGGGGHILRTRCQNAAAAAATYYVLDVKMCENQCNCILNMERKQCGGTLIILPSFANYSILALLDNVKLAKMSFCSLYISEYKNTSDIVFLA